MSLKSELTIRHNYKIAAATCVVSLVLALSWLGRAVSEGSPWDWFAVIVLGLIAGIEFSTLRDARIPLLVADQHGIRLRRGSQWFGLPWEEIKEVQVERRSGVFGDGAVRVKALDDETVWSTPLSLTTTTNEGDLVGVLNDLASGRSSICPPNEAQTVHTASPETADSAPPEAVSLERPIKQAVRFDQPIHLDIVSRSESADILVPRQRAEILSEETSDAPMVKMTTGPKLIGEQLKQARLESGLSLAALSDRTQIRAHVLQSMEDDDFSGCGGDFYARGHLRSVCRRLGLDADHFVAIHDAHYAQAPIPVRQVFESELNGVSANRMHRNWSMPRWGLLFVAVITAGSVWVGAQLLGDRPSVVLSPAPNVVDSVGLSSSVQTESNPQVNIATLTLSAVAVNSDVVVRDKSGRIIWADRLKPGQSHKVFGHAPFNVAASRASGVHLRLLGKDIGPVAKTRGGADRSITLPSPVQPSPH